MGGYASSVWPSVVLTVGIIVWNVLAARRSFSEAHAEARRRVAMEQAS
jgi:heme exporter protein CcmD